MDSTTFKKIQAAHKIIMEHMCTYAEFAYSWDMKDEGDYNSFSDVILNDLLDLVEDKQK